MRLSDINLDTNFFRTASLTRVLAKRFIWLVSFLSTRQTSILIQTGEPSGSLLRLTRLGQHSSPASISVIRRILSSQCLSASRPIKTLPSPPFISSAFASRYHLPPTLVYFKHHPTNFFTTPTFVSFIMIAFNPRFLVLLAACLGAIAKSTTYGNKGDVSATLPHLLCFRTLVRLPPPSSISFFRYRCSL